MSKESVRKATFKDLLAKKIQKEESEMRFKDIYVSSMDATLTFKKPSDDLICDMIDELKDEENTRKLVEVYKKLIYQCCPMLQDTELHKELEVVDPLDTVSKIFDLKDIMEIGEKLEDLIDIGTKVEEIKN